MRQRRILFALLIVAALAFRLKIVDDYSAPAGDGWQYYRLAESLRVDHRYAYEPHGQPAWSRLPGYPLFLAAMNLGYRGHIDIDTHVRHAAYFNAVFDVSSALLVALLAEAEAGLVAAVLAFGMIVFCPILVQCSTFALTESFATFLGVAAIFVALRARGRTQDLVATGALLGFAQLTRVDTFTILPAILLALCTRLDRRALRSVVIVGATALVVWLPWPVRNLALFHAPHAEGTEWLAQDGTPLPAGVMVWMRSWASGIPGEGYDLLAIANGAPLDVKRPGIVLPQMYDDAAEKSAVEEVLLRYDRERLSPWVDARFVELGQARARANPLRQYLKLPLQRLDALWTPIPKYELPVKVRWIGYPKFQKLWGQGEHDVFLACLLCLLVCLPLARRLLGVAALVIVGRSLLHSTIAHPCPTERYLVECTPFVLLCGAVAIGKLVAFVRARLATRRAAR